jgi:methyltransferase (TIGR00027 family)
MQQVNRDRKPAPGLVSEIVASVLFVLLLPVMILGYIIWVGYGLFTWRKSGISGTAQGPLSARFIMHRLGTRRDEAADRLMRALPNVPPLGLWLSMWPVVFIHQLTGHVPGAFRYPFEGDVPPQYEASARMTFFDRVLERSLPGIPQFVLLGAGFDTRAYRLPASWNGRAFEVDAPRTQQVKRQILARSGVESTGVTFVPADFETDDWMARLVEAGFDPGRPALFLWEGVIIYLDREAVEATLRKIAATAAGSLVTFDYFTTETLTSPSLYWRYGRYATQAAGEPLKFGIDSTPPSRERLAELLRTCGLELVEQQTLGQETGTRRAWGGFATAIVPGDSG